MPVHIDRQRQMLCAGAILFFLGLLSGFVIPLLLNPRMALASHLEGVMNGTFLIAMGAVWAHLALKELLEKITFWLLIYGTYANWLFVSLAAIFGTSYMTPIAGKGYVGAPWQEQLVNIGLGSVGVAMVVGCGIVVYGLIRRKEDRI